LINAFVTEPPEIARKVRLPLQVSAVTLRIRQAERREAGRLAFEQRVVNRSDLFEEDAQTLIEIERKDLRVGPLKETGQHRLQHGLARAGRAKNQRVAGNLLANAILVKA
jgi:hypothetical protein